MGVKKNEHAEEGCPGDGPRQGAGARRQWRAHPVMGGPVSNRPLCYLRCRIRDRIRRFLRPTFRRPLPRRRLPISATSSIINPDNSLSPQVKGDCRRVGGYDKRRWAIPSVFFLRDKALLAPHPVQTAQSGQADIHFPERQYFPIVSDCESPDFLQV